MHVEVNGTQHEVLQQTVEVVRKQQNDLLSQLHSNRSNWSTFAQPSFLQLDRFRAEKTVLATGRWSFGPTADAPFPSA